MAKECDKPRPCNNCDQPGHTARSVDSLCSSGDMLTLCVANAQHQRIGLESLAASESFSHYPNFMHTNPCSAVERKVTLSNVAPNPSRRRQKLRTGNMVDLAMQTLPGMLAVCGSPTELLQAETIGRTTLLRSLLLVALLRSLLLVAGRLSLAYSVVILRQPCAGPCWSSTSSFLSTLTRMAALP